LRTMGRSLPHFDCARTRRTQMLRRKCSAWRRAAMGHSRRS